MAYGELKIQNTRRTQCVLTQALRQRGPYGKDLTSPLRAESDPQPVVSKRPQSYNLITVRIYIMPAIQKSLEVDFSLKPPDSVCVCVYIHDLRFYIIYICYCCFWTMRFLRGAIQFIFYTNLYCLIFLHKYNQDKYFNIWRTQKSCNGPGSHLPPCVFFLQPAWEKHPLPPKSETRKERLQIHCCFIFGLFVFAGPTIRKSFKCGKEDSSQNQENRVQKQC